MMTDYLSLADLAQKYEDKAQKAFTKYNQTGEQRYYREFSNNDELARGLRIAADSEDDNVHASLLDEMISEWATQVQQGKDVSKDVLRYAENNGLVKEHMDIKGVK